MATNWLNLIRTAQNHRFALDVDGMLRRNRALFGAARMEDNADAAKAAAEAKAVADAKAAADAAAAAAKAAADAAVNDKGYPDNTPVDQMTATQQANYWKHQSRKHEQRVKDFGGWTPEQIKDFQDKAAKHDQAEKDKASETEKAIAAAKEQAEKDAAAKFKPQLVTAKLETAAAAKGVSSEQLSKALEFVDSSKFLNDAGDVDTDKVSTFVDGIAPVKGNTRRGPTATGHGSGNGSGSDTALTGREMFEARHKKKSTSTA